MAAGDTQITIVGNLVGDPELRYTPTARAAVAAGSAAAARGRPRIRGPRNRPTASAAATRPTSHPSSPLPEPHHHPRRVRGSHRSTTMAKAPIRKPRKKVCLFCQEKIAYVDYKDTPLLRKFISDRGKIRARRVTGNCTQHQRDVATAIKNAREMAMLPYTSTPR